MNSDASLPQMSRFLYEELLRALGLSAQRLGGRLIEPLSSLPRRRFAELALEFDRVAADENFCSASQRVLPYFARRVKGVGDLEIPTAGPLLITANHPGTIDALAIAALIRRPDLKVVVSGVPFIRNLPGVRRFLIYSSLDTHERMNVVRASIRHLREGGALLIFPSGGIDPDPSIDPKAHFALDNWSRSLDLLLNRVPECKCRIALVGGVLLRRFALHPITRLRSLPRDRLRIAEFLQISQQILFPGSLRVSPRVAFSADIVFNDADEFTPQFIAAAQRLLAEHWR